MLLTRCVDSLAYEIKLSAALYAVYCSVLSAARLLHEAAEPQPLQLSGGRQRCKRGTLTAPAGHAQCHVIVLKPLQVLGKGQFGVTRLVVDKATGEHCACKSISKRKLVTPEDMEDVRREIKVMHHLSGHQHVVTFKGGMCVCACTQACMI